jgi:hypothetical protein
MGCIELDTGTPARVVGGLAVVLVDAVGRSGPGFGAAEVIAQVELPELERHDQHGLR